MGTSGATTRGGRRSHGRHRAPRLPTCDRDGATFKTAEFWAMLGPIAAILVTATVISGGDYGTDGFIARQTWLYVAILGGAYFISRGLAKSGTQTHMTRRPRAPRREALAKRGGRVGTYPLMPPARPLRFTRGER
jgi:hypothetical protein